MQPLESQEPPADLAFAPFLDNCMALGIWPSNPKKRTPRRAKEFGTAAGQVSDTQVRNWRAGRHLPPSLTGIELALFGTDPTYLPTWRQELRRSYERAKAGQAQDTSPDGPSPPSDLERNKDQINSPIELQIFASVSGAKGLIHIVWLISLLSQNDLSYLISQAWPCADLVLGPSGIALCYGTITYKSWTQFLGTSLCALGNVLAVLWIVDSYSQDLPAQQFVMGGLSLVYYIWGFYFYLKRWPDYFDKRDDYRKLFE